MKPFHLARKLLAVVRYFFNFRKPEFTEIDFIDLVIDNKPLFLLVWKSRNAHVLKIKSVKTYRKSKGSVIILIPSSKNNLVIQLKNIWRSKKVKVDIQHIQLDNKTASLLLNKIKQINFNGEIVWKTPLSAVSTHFKELIVQKRIAGVKNIVPAIKRNSVVVKNIQPRVIRRQLIKTENVKYTKNTD